VIPISISLKSFIVVILLSLLRVGYCEMCIGNAKYSRNAGGKDNGPPGERDYVKGYYAAFVLDPDGNNIECMYWNPWWLEMMNQAPKLLGVGAVLLAWYCGKTGWTAF
jgi:predicted lactoylglutathione lyase